MQATTLQVRGANSSERGVIVMTPAPKVDLLVTNPFTPATPSMVLSTPVREMVDCLAALLDPALS